MSRYLIAFLVVLVMVFDIYPDDLGGHYMTTEDIQER